MKYCPTNIPLELSIDGFTIHSVIEVLRVSSIRSLIFFHFSFLNTYYINFMIFKIFFKKLTFLKFIKLSAITTEKINHTNLYYPLLEVSKTSSLISTKEVETCDSVELCFEAKSFTKLLVCNILEAKSFTKVCSPPLHSFDASPSSVSPPSTLLFSSSSWSHR
jgi:hypothetical protein